MTDILENISEFNMFELATKTNYGVSLTDDEKDVTAELSERFEEIGRTGHDPDHLISQFITKTLNQEIYDAPDDLLDMMFDRNNIGEFDDMTMEKLPPENTLVAHEAAKGGNVERSFLDYSVAAPIWKNRQV